MQPPGIRVDADRILKERFLQGLITWVGLQTSEQGCKRRGPSQALESEHHEQNIEINQSVLSFFFFSSFQ